MAKVNPMLSKKYFFLKVVLNGKGLLSISFDFANTKKRTNSRNNTPKLSMWVWTINALNKANHNASDNFPDFMNLVKNKNASSEKNMNCEYILASCEYNMNVKENEKNVVASKAIFLLYNSRANRKKMGMHNIPNRNAGKRKENSEMPNVFTCTISIT